MFDSSNSIPYAAAGLDRAAEQRADSAWLDRQRQHPGKLVLPVCGMQHLVCQPNTSTVRAIRLQGGQAQAALEGAITCILLGLQENLPVFTVEIPESSMNRWSSALSDAQWLDLRQCGSLLSSQDAGLLAYARAMLYWHRSHPFCSHCGSATSSGQGGHVRRCQNPDCGRDGFPRTDPAVIMRVEYPPEGAEPPLLLLARQARWQVGAYSVLAGFVEPGETLEQAVAREVLEEAGVRVTDITYQGSQPWPFPASLMLGFSARALSLELDLGSRELEHADWFAAEQLRGFGEWGDPGAALCLPRRDSISRRLIEDWLQTVDPASGSLP